MHTRGQNIVTSLYSLPRYDLQMSVRNICDTKYPLDLVVNCLLWKFEIEYVFTFLSELDDRMKRMH